MISLTRIWKANRGYFISYNIKTAQSKLLKESTGYHGVPLSFLILDILKYTCLFGLRKSHGLDNETN